jgi:hypothetical protein
VASDRTGSDASIPYAFGMPLESALVKRERLADRYDYNFGQERLFPGLDEALMEEVDEGAHILEVGAASGLLTGVLLGKADKLTALEPSQGLLRRLMQSELADDERLTTVQGLVEDLPRKKAFDQAVVTFTPRRGMGLVHLLIELARRVKGSVVMLLDEDGTLDWAYVARSAAVQGFDVRLRLVSEKRPAKGADPRTAVIIVANVGSWTPQTAAEEQWEFGARTLDVPFPSPRGTATRLVRYFLAGGDRILIIRTEREGLDRLYGNLRTAVHRIARDEMTVRRMDDGVQIVRLSKPLEQSSPLG